MTAFLGRKLEEYEVPRQEIEAPKGEVGSGDSGSGAKSHKGLSPIRSKLNDYTGHHGGRFRDTIVALSVLVIRSSFCSAWLHTMLQQTAERLSDLPVSKPVTICTRNAIFWY